MKRIGFLFLLLALVFAFGAREVWAEMDYKMEDSVWDKTGDWLAVFGKSGDEREVILLERRTARQAARFQRAIRLESKKAGRKVEKFTKEMEKLFES